MTKLRLFPARWSGLAALAVAVVMAGALVKAQAPVPPVLSASVTGPHVQFTWTAVAGATSYTLQAGVAPGAYLLSANVGNTTTTSATAPAVGTYFVRVVADVGGVPVASAEIPVQVVSMSAPPAAPTNLAAFINGTGALITWDLGTGGGAPTSLLLYAGTTPGGSDIGVFPIAVGTQIAVGSVAPTTYYLRLVAVNQGGASAASNEATMVMPVGGGCSAPPARTFTPAAFGRYLQLTWAGVPGASGFRLDFATSPGGPSIASDSVGGNATRWSYNGAPLGTYYGTLTTFFSCGTAAAGPETTIVVDGAPPPGPRSPNPPPGQRLPLRSQDARVIEQLAAERPDLLNASCKEHGGNNRFMFEAVRRLRAIDNRYGLNWKRGLVGDLSQDIVNYNYSSDSDEGTRNVYIIDIIGGHCGSRPSAAWIDQTEATRNAGTIGIWTLIPYLDSGYPIVSDPQP